MNFRMKMIVEKKSIFLLKMPKNTILTYLSILKFYFVIFQEINLL